MPLAAAPLVRLWTDLRYSARSFTRSPGLAITLWITIALGIGSNASVYGFIRGLNAPGVRAPGRERVVSLFARDAHDGFGPVSYDEYRSIEAQDALFDSIGAARESQASLTREGRVSVVSVAAVTPELAALLGFSLRDGVVISRRFRETEFAAKPRVHGESVRLDGVDARVSDVAPEGLDGIYRGRDIDIWIPLPDEADDLSDRRSRTFWTIARLRSGSSASATEAALNATRRGGDLIAVLPYTGMTPEVSSGIRRVEDLLRAAAAIVFVVACANVASFLLARASARSHETSVRVALGARRSQIAGQVVADSILVASAGGALAVLLAVWTVQIVPALFFDADAEQLVFAPDLSGILATVAACGAITIACGVMPLVEVRHDDPAAVLQRESAGPSAAMRRVRAALVVGQLACCGLLVTGTVLLLVSFRTALDTRVAHTLGQPILARLEARFGFDESDLGSKYFEDAERAVMQLPQVARTAWTGRMPGSRPAWQPVRIERPQAPVREIVMNVAAFTPRSLPLVLLPARSGRMFAGRDTPGACTVVVVNQEAADELFDGAAVGRMLEDPAGRRVEIVGVVAMRTTPAVMRHPPTIFYYAEQTGTPLDRIGPAAFRARVWPKSSSAILDVHVVSPAYFDVMGLAPIAGSVLPAHLAPSSCRIAVINQEAADLYFGGNAVGGAVIDTAGRRTTIVGVVRPALLRASQRRDAPAIYFPMRQDFVPRMTMILGTAKASEALVETVRQRLDAVPGGKTPPNVTTLEAHLARTALAPERIAAALVTASTVMALALGALGVYGAIAESTRHRRREIALRIALGAHGWRVIRQVLSESVRLASAGTAAGMLASAAVAIWLRRSVPSAQSVTPWVWAGAPLALFVLVAVATVFPARRALSVDPLTIMRDTPL